MKKLFFFFFLFVFFYDANAQVSGYQGQRFSIGYNAGISMALEHLDDGLGMPDAIIPHLNYKTEINANFAISRKANLCFQYSTAKQGYLFSDYGSYYNDTYDSWYNPAEERASVRFAIYEFHVQIYRKNFIAPTGLYNEFGVGLVKYNMAGKNSVKMKKVNDYYNSGSGPSEIEVAIPDLDYSGFKVSYFIGKTNPLGHRLYINTAFGINLFTGGDLPKVTSNDNRYYFLSNMNHFIKSQNLIEFRLGLGFLAL